MKAEKIVQFVSFETTLDSEQFIAEWEQYTRPLNSDLDVTMQQSEKNGVFRYLVQHRCASGDFQFVVTKGKRSSRIPEVGIKEKQIGGYSVLQAERKGDTLTGESKVFVFLIQPQADLDSYRMLPHHGKLNIYEAFYENCQFAYILEYFLKDEHISAFQEELKLIHTDMVLISKECNLQES